MSRCFSVIIPCKGHLHYIPRCLMSVAWQLQDQDEIIVILDEPVNRSTLEKITKEWNGITDAVGATLRIWVNDAEVNPCQSTGVSAARNLGVLACNHDPSRDEVWLKFLDADDLAAPFSFAAMRGLTIPETICVVAGQQLTYVDGSYNGTRAANFDVFENYNPCLISNTFVRMRSYYSVKGFDERIDFEEDWDFWLRIATNYSKKAFGGINVPFCFYHISPLERAAKQRTHKVGDLEVRQYLKQTYGIDPK